MSSATTPNRTTTEAVRRRAELRPRLQTARTIEIGRVKRLTSMRVVARSCDRPAGLGWGEAL